MIPDSSEPDRPGVSTGSERKSLAEPQSRRAAKPGGWSGRECVPSGSRESGTSRPCLRRKAGHRLFWRLYLYGLLQLLAVGTAGILVASLLHDEQPLQQLQERAAGFLEEELSPQLGNAGELTRRLSSLQRSFGGELAVYGAGGRLLAGAGGEGRGPEPLEQPPQRRHLRMKSGRLQLELPLGRQGSYLIFRTDHTPGQQRPLLVLLAVLAALAAVSFPLARAVVRPLERLTEAARRLGLGELGVRSGLTRKDEIGVLAAAFDEMAERLQGLITGEKELLANVSHELRTPLARLRVALELAEEEQAGGELPGSLQELREDLGELEQLVEDVLAVTRLDLTARTPGAAPRLRRVPLDLAELLVRTARRFCRLHPEHRLILPGGLSGGEVDGGELEEILRRRQLPLSLEADPQLFHRVLDNLLDNAARYAPPESGPVELELESEPGSGELRVQVKDRGPGISPEDLPRLFEPFYRGDRSRDRASGGSGLGLALCRRVVEAHGGRIQAGQREGGGAVFSFSSSLSQ